MKQKFKTVSGLMLLMSTFFFINESVAKDLSGLGSLQASNQYFIKDIDINQDKLLDKIVSSKKHQGNEIYFYVNNGTNYQLALKSINFSEDGGNIIGDIKAETANDEVLSIFTYFPDGGHLTAKHFISFTNGDWYLNRTVYEVVNWHKDPAKKYICNINQKIRLRHLSDGSAWGLFKTIPKEKDRAKLCL